VQLEQPPCRVPGLALTTLEAALLQRHQRNAIAGIAADQHMAGAIGRDHGGGRTLKISTFAQRQGGVSQRRRHEIARSEALDPLPATGLRHRIHHQHRRQIRRRAQAAADLGVKGAGAGEPLPESALRFWHCDEQPAKFEHQWPGPVLRCGQPLGAEHLACAVAQFDQFGVHSRQSFGSRGMPSRRSAMMLRWISSLPPAMVQL
jgi:hypothetical protein